MKNSIQKFKLVLCVSSIISIIACEDQQGYNEFAGRDCREFTLADRDSLLQGYKARDEIITFKNQNGNELNYKVLSNMTETRGYYSGTFWGSSTWLVFCYDRQVIEMELLENPDPTCPTKIVLYKQEDNRISGGIHFPLWNSYGSVSNELNDYANVELDFREDIQVISLNGKVYDKVLLIESDSTEPLGDFGPLPKTINKLYYDINDGIIGFDDLDGIEWRLD